MDNFRIPIITQTPNIPNAVLLDQLCKPTLADMQRRGTAIDLDWLSNLDKSSTERINEIEEKVRRRGGEETRAQWAYVPTEDEDGLDYAYGDSGMGAGSAENTKPDSDFNLNSPEQVAEFLFNVLGAGSKVGGLRMANSGLRYSTDKKQLKLVQQYYKEQNKVLEAEQEFVDLMLEYRELSKLRSTYIRALPRRAILHPKGVCPICSCPAAGRAWERVVHREAHYRIHTRFVVTRASTGRLASRYPNLQNIPIRSKLGKEIRKAFLGSDGLAWLAGDYSQVELRVLAALSQDPVMLECFRRGEDIHYKTAMEILGVTDKSLVPDDFRRACKIVNFGIVYGMTAQGLVSSLALERIYWALERCEHFMEEQWFQCYPNVRPFMKRANQQAKVNGYVHEMFGGVRFTPELRSVHKRIQAAGERQAGNLAVQGSASGLMKLALYKVRRVFDVLREDGIEVWPLLTIHDELDMEGDKRHATEISACTRDAMATVADFGVPIKVDMNPPSDRWKKS